jgi:WD40-like Beta Propeller Repeat
MPLGYPSVGRSRTLLLALLVLLVAPASALAGPCIDVTTGVATSVTATSATLTGSLDPHGQAMSFRFQLGPTVAYGTSTPTRNSTITVLTNVNEKLLALTPGTTYHYRLVGITACGTEYGLDGTFATPLSPGQQPLAVVPLVYTSWTSGNAEVNIVGSDGNGARDLSNSPASDFDPALSPDGTRVVFTSTRTGHGDLYVVDQDGSGLVQITRSPYADVAPAWSPDGKQIVFASSGPAGPGLFLVNADGTGRRRLTTDKGGASDPSWSPNGLTIAFTRSVKGTAAEIYTVPAAGGTATRLTHNTVPDIWPAWSPDGTHLAWTRTSATGASSLIVALANDTGETTVTAASDLARQPVYTHDGTRIAYVGLGGGSPALTVLVLGGPTLRLLPLTP